MHAFLFDSRGKDQEVEPRDDLDATDPDTFYWLQLGADDPLPPGVPALDRSGSMQRTGNAFVFRAPGVPNSAGLNAPHIDFYVGGNWLVTRSACPVEPFARFLDQDRGEGLRGRLSGPAMVSALLLMILAAYRDRIAEVDDQVDTLDQTILRTSTAREPLAMLAVLRRRLARLRQGLGGYRSIVHTLVRPDFSAETDGDDDKHFEHLEDMFDRVEDQLAAARDAVNASFDLYATRVGQETNRLLEVLTVVTVATGIVSMTGGLFGMDFDLGVEDWGWKGFAGVVIGSLLLTCVIILFSRRRRWR